MILADSVASLSWGWGTAALLLCAASGWAVAWKTIRGRPKAAKENAPLEAPIHLLSLDLRKLKQELDALQSAGLKSLSDHLKRNPELARSWRSFIRLSAASSHTYKQLNARSLNEVQTWWDSNRDPLWHEVLLCLLDCLWTPAALQERVIHLSSEAGTTPSCLLTCQIPQNEGRFNFSEVLLSVHTFKKNQTNLGSDQDVLSAIFKEAKLMVWWARVEMKGSRLIWTNRLPLHSRNSPLFKLAGAPRIEDIWDLSKTPDAERMERTAYEALSANRDHYEQEFRVPDQDGIHWIHEHVSIKALAENHWELVAIATEVTARHRAEEAHQQSEFQIQQILRSADVLLWRATVTATPPSTFWTMYVPPSVLYRRLFGCEPDNDTPLLWLNQNIPERAELDARSTRALYEGWPGYEQEFRVITRDSTFWLHEHVTITKRSDTEWSVVGVIMDITARRKAEQELACEKERLTAALQQLQSAGLKEKDSLPGASSSSSCATPATPATLAASPAPAASPASPANQPTPAASPEQAFPLNNKAAPGTAASAALSAVATAPQTPATNTAMNPVSNISIPGASQARTVAPSPAFDKLQGKLLLMDDEEPIQRLAVRLIKRLGLEVDVCGTGEEAIQLYKVALDAGSPYDLVMMDLHVPGSMGGREAIGPLRELNPAIKALVSSGASGDTLPGELERLGFSGNIPKPYDVASLHRTLKELLAH